MSAKRDAEQVDIRAQLAKHADARQPARGDFDGVGVDPLHAADRQQALPDIVTSMNAITAMTLAFIDSLDMIGFLQLTIAGALE